MMTRRAAMTKSTGSGELRDLKLAHCGVLMQAIEESWVRSQQPCE
jgi:hypothetical protein